MSNSLSQLTVIPVNKFKENWNVKTLFSNFTVRAILKDQNDLITKIVEVQRMKKRLTREIGIEDTHWFLIENITSGEDELYLNDASILVMWKLQNNEDFDSIFDRVEQHKDNILQQ